MTIRRVALLALAGVLAYVALVVLLVEEQRWRERQ